MFVRLKQAATVLLEGIGHHWHPAGAEVEIPPEDFDPVLHEDLSPPPEALAPSAAPPPGDSTPTAADSTTETPT